MVENLPANAGHTGSSPGLGRSHMPRSNSACEPQLLSLRVWSLCSAIREAAIVRGPRTAPQLEKALAQKQRPNTAKKKKSVKSVNRQFTKWEIPRVPKHMRRCLTSLVIRKTKIYTMTRCHFTLRLAQIKSLDDAK